MELTAKETVRLDVINDLVARRIKLAFAAHLLDLTPRQEWWRRLQKTFTSAQAEGMHGIRCEMVYRRQLADCGAGERSWAAQLLGAS
jgi:hypothetical protein